MSFLTKEHEIEETLSESSTKNDEGPKTIEFEKGHPAAEVLRPFCAPCGTDTEDHESS